MYFTITGTKHHYGTSFMIPGMKVILEKDPDNDVDNEAIRVKMEGLGTVGFVANSPYTVLGECFSAGRMYDKIGDSELGVIKYVLPNAAVCLLESFADNEFDSDEEIFSAD